MSRRPLHRLLRWDTATARRLRCRKAEWRRISLLCRQHLHQLRRCRQFRHRVFHRRPNPSPRRSLHTQRQCYSHQARSPAPRRVCLLRACSNSSLLRHPNDKCTSHRYSSTRSASIRSAMEATITTTSRTRALLQERSLAWAAICSSARSDEFPEATRAMSLWLPMAISILKKL